MKLSDIHQPLPNDAVKRWPKYALQNHKAGDTIYVHATALKHFARTALATIDKPFTLVTGDSVLDLTPKSIGAKVFDQIINHPFLTLWYSQNLGLEHPKLHPIPLGLDYHSISRNRRPDWGPAQTPLQQERDIYRIRADSPKMQDKHAIGHSSWQFMPGNGDREQVLKVFPIESTFFEPQPLSRVETWRRNSEYFFTISPRGRGMDCHRTWEALLIGSVPVIPDLPINALFQTLPVIVVNDWSQVTPAFLSREKDRILTETYDFAPVLLETWRRKIRSIDTLPELRMTFQGFLDLDEDALRAYTQMP